MYLQGKEPSFGKTRKKANPYRILVLLALIVFFFTILSGIARGNIEPLFMPTPTPTRSTDSFVVEGETHFAAGDLDSAIAAFQSATELDPNDPGLFTELARIQTYSSALSTTDAERSRRLQEALASIDQAKELAPNDSQVLAVRAFVLDWLSNPLLADDETSEDLLNEAESEAVLALQIDNTNTLALAYYAEILVDQKKWNQAQQYIQQAVERAPDLMDVRRIQAYTYETLGEYNLSIQEYEMAIEIMPNYTYLYIAVGRIYRYLKLYDQALENFAKAANLNKQLGITDPIPYLAIANTYAQDGEFFAAALNVKQAITFTPANPDVYGQLGVIYFKSRNYEGSIPALACAIEGCDAEQSCEVRECDPEEDPLVSVEGLPLSGSSVVYYFTYGSVLSGLHREGDDKCEKALEIFDELRSQYADDPTIMSIVRAGEEICTYDEDDTEK
ncbi:MAG: tetratricopeptide repeat protein [Chloroflexota bacterium]|nr:tetratricopeptide repeat protein [Chloroflexota bacterium]